MQGEVEGGRMTPLDVLNRAIGEEVGHVPGLIHRDVALMEVQRAGRCAMAEVVDPAAQNPIELIEAVLEGAVLWEIAQVPLADQRRIVARAFEDNVTEPSSPNRAPGATAGESLP